MSSFNNCWMGVIKCFSLCLGFNGTSIAVYCLSLSFIFTCTFADLKNVDYGRMAEILVRRAASHDEFTRLTAITWVRKYTHASPLAI